MARRDKKNNNLYICVDLDEHREDVAGLTPLQRGLYESLRFHYFEFKRPLPNVREQLYTIAGAQDSRERKAVDAVIAAKFSLGTDGLLHNLVCDGELDRIEQLKAKKRRAGQASAQVRWGNTCYSAAITDVTNKGIKELRNERNTKDSVITPPEVHLERNSVDVPRNTPAPSGADIDQETMLLSDPDYFAQVKRLAARAAEMEREFAGNGRAIG